MKKRNFDTSDLPEKPPAMRGRKKNTEYKVARVGVKEHNFLKHRALAEDTTMKELLDKIINKYKDEIK